MSHTKDYQTILEDHAHALFQTWYPEGCAVYQDNNGPITHSKTGDRVI